MAREIPRYRMVLNALGFNSAEIAVYEHLLRAGGGTATEISQSCQVSRTNVYYLAQKLVANGIVKKTATRGSARFVPAHPSSLQTLLAQRRADVERTETELASVFEDLLTDYSLSGTQPGVFRFTGKAGLVRAYDELIADGDPLQSIMDRMRLRAYLGSYNDTWVRERVRRKVMHRIICPKQKEVRTADVEELRVLRTLPAEKFPFAMDIKITRRKVVLTTFDEDASAGVIVSDPLVARNFLVLFECLWGIAERSYAPARSSPRGARG